MISQTTDNFPPESVKEVIGQLAIATARSTEPANKLSLTSSRISVMIGVMTYKCRKFMVPGLNTLLYETIRKMIEDVAAGTTVKETFDACMTLETRINDIIEERARQKPLYRVDESLDLLTDYNEVRQCREHWKVANAKYMEGETSYGKSNEILANIHDVLTIIELKYNLIVMPKHYSFDVNDMRLFGKQEEPPQ